MFLSFVTVTIEAENSEFPHTDRRARVYGSMAGHAFPVAFGWLRQACAKLVACPALLSDRFGGIEFLGVVLGNHLIVRIMARDTVTVVPPSLDRFACMRTCSQLGHHLAMATCAVIGLEEVGQGLVDVRTSWMGRGLKTAAMAVGAGELPMDRDMAARSVNKPRGSSLGLHARKNCYSPDEHSRNLDEFAHGTSRRPG